MAGKKKKQDITTTITSEEHFMQFYSENNKKLTVVDLYPGWSGPCTAMFPTYNQLMLTIDDFEKRIDILLLDQDKLNTYKSEKFTATCKPKFLFISEGKIIETVEGTNIPVFVDRYGFTKLPYLLSIFFYMQKLELPNNPANIKTQKVLEFYLKKTKLDTTLTTPVQKNPQLIDNDYFSSYMQFSII